MWAPAAGRWHLGEIPATACVQGHEVTSLPTILCRAGDVPWDNNGNIPKLSAGLWGCGGQKEFTLLLCPRQLKKAAGIFLHKIIVWFFFLSLIEVAVLTISCTNQGISYGLNLQIRSEHTAGTNGKWCVSPSHFPGPGNTHHLLHMLLSPNSFPKQVMGERHRRAGSSLCSAGLMSSWSPGLGSAAQSGHGATKGAKVDAEGGKWMGKAEMGEIWGPTLWHKEAIGSPALIFHHLKPLLLFFLIYG